jgi:cell division protein DivIC
MIVYRWRIFILLPPAVNRRQDMKYLKRIPSFIFNKYFLSLSLFVVWILFFDRNDFFTQLQWRRELHEMQKSKAFYQNEIEENKKFSNDLKYNAATIEKFVREKYLMKRDNEDLFVIQKAQKNP